MLDSSRRPTPGAARPLLLDGAPVGELASVGWSPKAGACVGLGYLRGDAAQRAHAGTPIEVDLWGERDRRDRLGPLAAEGLSVADLEGPV